MNVQWLCWLEFVSKELIIMLTRVNQFRCLNMFLHIYRCLLYNFSMTIQSRTGVSIFEIPRHLLSCTKLQTSADRFAREVAWSHVWNWINCMLRAEMTCQTDTDCAAICTGTNLTATCHHGHGHDHPEGHCTHCHYGHQGKSTGAW